ncbi:MAG TPA: hypothetical protein VNH18_09530 [Bryobacteraceae bacterium]|nr:hypothetical protein [Bryobacteraceae bacterium]HXJ39510.1 hypothetical protein [Bryobacteraceae bacterium]
MLRWLFPALAVAAILGIGLGVNINRVPDLPSGKAADLISQAPEFNRYARLVKVEQIFHQKNSMDEVSNGQFTFQYLNSPVDAAPIKANADFRYWEATWHLNEFDYGCPTDCHTVGVYNDPPRMTDKF